MTAGRNTALSASASLFFVASSGCSNGEVFPEGLSQLEVECKASRKLRSSLSAESETTGRPAEKAAQAAWSVIQTGRATALPCGDSHITQSPWSRCILRKTGRLD